MCLNLCFNTPEDERISAPVQVRTCRCATHHSNAIEFLLVKEVSIPRDSTFRDQLFAVLKKGLSLLAAEGTCLSALNSEIGVFHKFRPTAKVSFDDLSRQSPVPPSWTYRGQWPGIWCTLYSPEYTCSLWITPPVVGRFEFVPGYKLYDPSLRDHGRLWHEWRSHKANRRKKNTWKRSRNSEGISMKMRVESMLGAPGHRAFYLEHGYGAIVGKDDYMAVVIIDHNAVRWPSDASQ